MTATLKTTVVQEPGSATANMTLDASGGVTVGQNLTVVGSVSGVAGRLLRAPQMYTSGSGDYTTPAGCKAIYVELVGGGAGGNTNGASGGAGGYAAKYFSPVVPSTNYAYVVGTGGTANGNAGTNSTFTALGTTVTATAGSGTTGGTPTNGDVNIRGGNGSGGGSNGKPGGNSYFGGGGGSGSDTSGAGSSGGNGTVGVAGGGGGGGGDGASRGSGGAGGAGLIRIWEYA